jgi:hypothetical protein
MNEHLRRILPILAYPQRFKVIDPTFKVSATVIHASFHSHERRR